MLARSPWESNPQIYPAGVCIHITAFISCRQTWLITYCQSCLQTDLPQKCERPEGLNWLLASALLCPTQEQAHLTSTCGRLDVWLTATPAHSRQELIDLSQREGVVQGLQGINGRNHGTAFKTWKETQSENELSKQQPKSMQNCSWLKELGSLGIKRQPLSGLKSPFLF